LAFNRVGDRLVSGGEDKTVRVWNLQSSAQLPLVLQGHGAIVRAVTFHPDGHRVASRSVDGELRLWDLRTDTLAEQICSRVMRNLTRSEWDRFVGAGIPYERTCPNWPAGDGVESQ
jgi:WD40 repeat protein